MSDVLVDARIEFPELASMADAGWRFLPPHTVHGAPAQVDGYKLSAHYTDVIYIRSSVEVQGVRMTNDNSPKTVWACGGPLAEVVTKFLSLPQPDDGRHLPPNGVTAPAPCAQ